MPIWEEEKLKLRESRNRQGLLEDAANKWPLVTGCLPEPAREVLRSGMPVKWHGQVLEVAFPEEHSFLARVAIEYSEQAAPRRLLSGTTVRHTTAHAIVGGPVATRQKEFRESATRQSF